ncbi:MAG: glyoxalase superfamily protein [Chitinophagaceae bacterium]
MIYQIRGIIAGIIILMGIVHICLVFPIDGSDINQVWFIGAGFALVLSGVLNIVAVKNCDQRWLGYTTIGSNILMLLLFIYARQVLREPQVYIGIYLYLAIILLHATQLIKWKRFKQYTHPSANKNAEFKEVLSDTEVVPILRIFDKTKTIEFYIDWLGFTIDWEHRFEENLPLYMQVSKAGIILHLSEHHGDTVPGGKVYITCEGLREFHKQLLDKNYSYNRPGLEMASWGTLEMTVIDPFGNKLLFTEKHKSGGT